MSEPTRVVILGRPNVGKSTLFNRLIGRRKALVHDLPGVTRDRNEQKTQWWVQGKPYDVVIVDTGGVGGDHFAEEIDQQVQTALEEADVGLVIFDGKSGLTPRDEDLLIKLRQSGVEKRVRLVGVVNKVDAEVHETMITDFFSSGLDPILTVSAEHGRGIDDLQAEVAAQAEPLLETPAEEEERDRTPRLAIVGRPNVGKSTLTNALLGQERMITSPIAGTTVDAVDSLTALNGKPFVLIDTAGIRRKSKTEQGVEVLSVIQAKKALERADIALLLLDGESGPTDQDEKIGGIIEEVGCSVIIGINKWDTQRKNQKFTRDTAAELIRKKMAFLRYAPIMFVSAKERRGFDDLGDLALDVLEQRKVKISTNEFTEWVRREAPIHNPLDAKFFMCHQTSRNPPTFVCHVNDPEKVHFSLRRHLVNRLREKWGFAGTPVRLKFQEGKSTRTKPKSSSPRKKKTSR